MKTLILYATKNGAAREIAQRIAALLGNTVIHDLKQGDIPELADYDCVIVGSSVYAGMFRKEAKTFLSQNANLLKSKKLGLFYSGLSADEEQNVFNGNIPGDVLQSAKATAFLGGIFDPKKAGMFGRFIMKIVSKQAEYADKIDDGRIEKFVEELRA
jgi:menaquinone-dependent protoporphyrinogen oxidase